MSTATNTSWQAMVESPLTFVREAALLESLGRAVSAEQLAALRQAPRFAVRLERRLTGHHRLQPLDQVPAPAEADLKVLSLTAEQFARLATLCGAVWHAATLSREIRGEVVAHYRERLGAPTLRLALEFRELAGAADLLRTPAALFDAIEQDGAACLNAWLAAQPDALRDWLMLRLPFPPLTTPIDARQAEVVRRVAAALVSGDSAFEALPHD